VKPAGQKGALLQRQELGLVGIAWTG
jgi:hypothetical protein